MPSPGTHSGYRVPGISYLDEMGTNKETGNAYTGKFNTSTGGYDTMNGLAATAPQEFANSTPESQAAANAARAAAPASSGGASVGGGVAAASPAPSVSPSMGGLQTAALGLGGPTPDALNGGGATPLRADLGYRTPASLQSLLSGKMY